MLSVVEAKNRRGSLLTMPLEDISEGYLLEEVEGLDPVKATLVSSSFAGTDGEQYQSSRREARNLKLKIALEPDYVLISAKDLRDRLYTYFMPKAEVTLKFYDSSGLTVTIVGRVEEFTCPLFVEEPKADISIMCFEPDFLEEDQILLSWETSNLTNVPEGRLFVPYAGTVETGVEFVLYPDRDLSEFTIYHSTYVGGVPDTFDFAAPLVAGDVLTISTVSGAKRVTLVRGATSSSLLWGKSPQAKWIELENGDNFIRFYAEGAPIPFDLRYTNRYGGL